MGTQVLSWSENLQWEGDGEVASITAPTDFAKHVLAEMANTYVPFVMANKAALNVGAKAFKANIYGEEVSYLTRTYPELSRQMFVERRQRLAETAQIDVWLEEHKLLSLFEEI